MTVTNNAEYLRSLRAKAIAEGKCSICRARPAQEGRKCCRECVVAKTIRANKRRARKLCVDCGLVKIRNPRRSRCQKCCQLRAPKLLEKNRKRAAKRHAAGRCKRCGIEPLAPGRSACKTCLRYVNERIKAHYRKSVNSDPRIGHCRACGEAGHYSNSANCPLAHVPTLE